MKTLVVIIFLLQFSSILISQVSGVIKTVTSKDGRSLALFFNPKKQRHALKEGQSLVKECFLLTNEDQLKIKSSTTDNLGIKHDRYAQYHNGIGVEYSDIIIHSKNDTIISINGEAFQILIDQISPSMEPTKSIDIALSKNQS